MERKYALWINNCSSVGKHTHTVNSDRQGKQVEGGGGWSHQASRKTGRLEPPNNRVQCSQAGSLSNKHLRYPGVFTSFSQAVSRCMGAAMLCLGWMSSAVLYQIVSPFPARLVEEQKCYSYNWKTGSYHCSRQLFIQGMGQKTCQ